MNPGVVALHKLEAMGYRLHLEGDNIRLRHEGQGAPNPNKVRPLIALVKDNKTLVMDYLAGRQESPPERILTCSECPWHQLNSWTLYPEFPSWCAWHFDHLMVNNPACVGFRREELPPPQKAHQPRPVHHNPVRTEEPAIPTCGACAHFLCSSINPLQGFGRCALSDVSGCPGAYPDKAACGHFEKRLAETVAKH